MRILRSLLLALGVLLGAAALLLGALRSEAGGALAARLAMQLVPGLRIEGLRLDLPWSIRLDRLVLADAEGPWLEADMASLTLSPRPLLHGEARLTGVMVGRLALARLPVAEADSEPASPAAQVLPSLPKLPLTIVLEALRIERLELAAPVLGQAVAFTAEGAARLAGGAATGHLSLDRRDSDGELRVDLGLAPAEDRLSARVSLREDGAGLLPALLGRPGEAVAIELMLDGPADGAALRLDGWLGKDVHVTARGTVSASPEGAFAAVLQGEARVVPLLPPGFAAIASPLAVTLDARLDPAGRLSLQALRLAAPAGQVAITGILDLADEALQLGVEAEIGAAAALAPGLPPGFAWKGMTAMAQIGGTLAAPKLDASLRPTGLQTGEPTLDAALGPSPVLSVKAGLPGPEATARLEGSAVTADLSSQFGPQLAAKLRISAPRLEALAPEVRGALLLEVTATGPRDDPRIVASIESATLVYDGRRIEKLAAQLAIEHTLSAPIGQLTLGGALEGLPLQLKLDARPDPKGTRITRGFARLGPAETTVTGVLAQPAGLFEGVVSLRVADLVPLAGLAGQPDLAGSLDAEINLAPLGQQQGITVQARAPRLRVAGQEGRLDFRAMGTPEDLRLDLGGEAGFGALTTQGRLRQQGAQQTLEITALTMRLQGQDLALLTPTRVQRGAAGEIVLAPADLALGSGRIRLEGRLAGDRLDGRATLVGLPLALAEPLLPALSPRGTLAGEVRLGGTLSNPDVTARLTGTDLASAAPAYRGLPKLGTNMEARLAGGQGQLRASIEGGPAGQVLVTARLPAGLGRGASVMATADGRLNLGALATPLLAAGADRVSGGLRLALRLDGPLTAPRFGGAAQFEGVSYRNAVSGLQLTEINGAVRGEGERLRLDGVQARMPGGGNIQLTGTLAPLLPNLPADLRLTARNARPVLGELGTVQFDADLTLRGPALGAGLLAGEIRVARADLRVPETLPTQVPTLDPVRYIGTPPSGVQLRQAAGETRTGLPPLDLAVRLLAPSQIFVRGRGIDVELGGDIALAGTLAAPQPSGGLRLRQGRLDILGRRLEFKRGSITFRAGTLLPELDLLAEATSRGTTLSVAVQGPPSAPEIILSATPELPPDEVMARLLFDRASSTLSPLEIAQIAQGIGQLTGLGGGFDPLGKTRDLLGLNRLGVAAAPQGQTGAALEAGKYLAPGVYVGLRQGMQGGQPGVAVQVELTPSLKLEGQTATGPAGDRLGITWEFEY